MNEDERKVVLASLKKVEAKRDEENRQVLMKERRTQTLVVLRESFLNQHPHLKLESDFKQVTKSAYYILEGLFYLCIISID